MYYELFIKDSQDRLEIKGFKFDLGIIRELFRIGVPSMLASLILNLGFFLINNEIAKYGTIVMNVKALPATSLPSVSYYLLHLPLPLPPWSV
jgi:Na+-driven multidrug efflux pump